MKSFTFIVILFTTLISCNSQSNSTARSVTLGGKDLYGDLFQKRYKSKVDTKIMYNKWPGKEVSSNQELENLLKVDPDCEAIEFVFRSHDTLQNFELTDKIGEFKKLKFLEINSNRITKYPLSIEKLSELEELILQTGEKSEIEFSFSNFKKLRHLTIHRADGLRELPPSIFECQILETLKLFRFFSLEDNSLAKVKNLKFLRELYLWDSNFNLPNDVDYQFSQLETLLLDRLTNPLPEYFYTIPTLKRVSLTSMPDTVNLNLISKMENLENLNLHYQKAFIGKLNLPKLEHLDITEFRGTDINIPFQKLESLESLVIWGCPNLTKLRNISNGNLKSVVIINNDKMEKINWDEGNLGSLKEVVMRSNDVLKNKPHTVNSVRVRESR